MLKISLREAETDEEIFFSVAWERVFNIRDPIYPELCREFYATYELQSKKIIIFRLGGRAHSLTLLEFARDWDYTMLRNWKKQALMLIFKEVIAKWMKRKGAQSQKDSQICYGQFISKIARKSGVLTDEVELKRASMQDLYERMGSMEIRQEAIERIEYRQAYHRDRYQGVFEHMAGVYNVLLQGNYNPPGYAQPQYDQYY
ncbi:hypothetical protein Tco_1495425 [Tanacetum coccineum]